MVWTLIATAVLAGTVATTVALAPTAAADTPSGGCDRGSSCSAQGPQPPKPKPDIPKATLPNPGSSLPNPLTKDFTADIPQGWKNDALWARPTPGGSSTTFGKGPRPPVLALD